MKKKILTLIAFLILAVTTTFAASGDTISKDASTTFASNFEKATDVKWKKDNSYYKASFKMNNQSLTAFISEEGNLIAVSKNILSTELPLSLKVSLTKNYGQYWISNLIEYAVDGETRYFVTIENADQTSVLQNIGTSDWNVLKKTSK